MKRRTFLLIIMSVIFIGSNLLAATKPAISIFYKDKPPSQKVLEKVNQLLEEFKDFYEVSYYNIDDPANSDLIAEFGLPSTHFPIAVVVNGKFTAKIDNKVISLIHFPLFMKGIGRHEGNWSIADLRKVMTDNSLLLEANILPILAEEETEGECKE